MEYILAHDVGTSGCKAVLFRWGGSGEGAGGRYGVRDLPDLLPAADVRRAGRRGLVERHGESHAAVSWKRAAPGRSRCWRSPSPSRCSIPYRWTKMASPLRNCISWLDGRAWEEAGQVMRKLGGPSIFSTLVGAVLSGKDLLPKYLWLKRHEPEIYQKAAVFMDCSSFMLHRTTGRLVYEWSVASVTGLFNLKSKTWDTTLIRLFGLDVDKFPELVRSIDKVGGLLPDAAQQMGLLAGTPVYGGAGDAMCTAVGSGAVGDGDAHIALGTSGYIGVTTARKVTGRQRYGDHPIC